MYIKVLLKRITDKKVKKLYIESEKVIKFIQDSNKQGFGSLGGKLLFGKIKDLDIFQIFSINYDKFSKKKGYLYWAPNDDKDLPWGFQSVHDIDNFFIPSETDITTEFIEEHLFRREKDTQKIDSIGYKIKSKILVINGKSFTLSGDVKYKKIMCVFLANRENTMKIFDIAAIMDYSGKEYGKEEKDIRNAYSFFNKQISEKFNIQELIGVEDKALVKKFPIIIDDSN